MTGIINFLLFWGMEVLTLFHTLRNDSAKAHRVQNEAAWKHHRERYMERYKEQCFIERQNLMTDMVYGKKAGFLTERYMKHYQNADGSLQAAGNACEIIALYNVMHALGKSGLDFPKLLMQFERRGAMLHGNFGTSLPSICRFLKKEGYDVKVIFAEKKWVASSGQIKESAKLAKLSKQYDCFLFAAWNHAGHPGEGLHTMCITKTKKAESARETFVVHNDYTADLQGNAAKQYHLKQYENLMEAMVSYNSRKGKQSKPVCVIGIKAPQSSAI